VIAGFAIVEKARPIGIAERDSHRPTEHVELCGGRHVGHGLRPDDRSDSDENT
jgi:hypothetical protein